MKPCQNVQQFLDKVDDFKEIVGKPLQFSDISDDLDKTYQHIIEQKDMIKGTVENFKKLVFRIAVQQKIMAMVGEQSYGDQDVELLQRNPNLNEKLMSLQLMYIGGVIDSAQIPQLRKFIIRATRC